MAVTTQDDFQTEYPKIQAINIPYSTHRECIIDGMDMSYFVPNYMYVNTRKWKNGAVSHHLTSDTALNIFINSLYEALKAFMIYVGFEPTEIFPYTYINERKGSKEPIYRRKYYRRLGIENKPINDNIKPKEGQEPDPKRVAKIIKARFFDNDPMNNWGFGLRISARDVQIHLLPCMQLCDHNGMPIHPTVFFREFLFTINYPLHIYNYQKKHGTFRRLQLGYDDLIYHKNKFEPYNFPL